MPAMSVGGSQGTQKIGNFRWVICSLLFLATTINYLDRQILSLVKEQLDAQLGWSSTQFGLVNSAFQGAYAVSVLGFGWLIDRYGVKFGYALSICLWSLMAMAHAAVGSVSAFLVARVGLGIGEGGNYPAAVKAVALWFPQRERALANSLFNAGSNVGAIIAPAIVPAIAYRFGWRAAFLFAGATGLAWLALWLPLFSLPRESQRLRAPERDFITAESGVDDQSRTASWSRLLRLRATWAFMLAKFCTDPVWWFFLIWLPDFFHKVYGLEIRQSWPKLVALYAIITVLSVAGGWLSGRLIRGGWSVNKARKGAMLLFAVCVVPVMLATRLPVWPAVLLIALAGAAHQAWSATLYTTVSDQFPRSAVASVTSLGTCAGALSGMLFPVFCGQELDRFRALGAEAAAYSYLLNLCAFAYLVTFVLQQLANPKMAVVSLR
jgi:MFS transporter, ACS family, hexuronate transporter